MGARLVDATMIGMLSQGEVVRFYSLLYNEEVTCLEAPQSS